MENIHQVGSAVAADITPSGENILDMGSSGGTYMNPNDNLELQKSLVKQKETELKEMQDQIESFNQMVKQLTSQRELAIKRLADMDVKIKEMTAILETERKQVDEKDQELKSKRTQLQTLKNEEDELKNELDSSKKDLDVNAENLTTTKLNNSQLASKIAELKQFLTTTNTTIEDIERSMSSKDSLRLNALCSQPLNPPAPLSVNAILTNGKHLTKSTFGNSKDSKSAKDGLEYDPFADEDPFLGNDPFAGEDPFKSEDANLALPEDDPFNPSASSSSGAAFSGQINDPFAPSRSTLDGF